MTGRSWCGITALYGATFEFVVLRVQCLLSFIVSFSSNTQIAVQERDRIIEELSTEIQRVRTANEQAETRARLAATYFDKEIMLRLQDQQDLKKQYAKLEEDQVLLLAEERKKVEVAEEERRIALEEKVATLEDEKSKLCVHREENVDLLAVL